MITRPAKNCAILLAAGRGERMRSSVPKSLLPLCKKPLVYWAIKPFQQSSSIDAIVVVVPSNLIAKFKKMIGLWKFRKVISVVGGGKERTDSTRAGLSTLPSSCKFVAIHDAARPFVSTILIDKVFNLAKKVGSVILAVPCKDTLKMVGKNLRIKKTVPRENVWLAQTPQVFPRDIAEKIHSRPRHATDDASIAESMGFTVYVLPSSYENLKITTPEDLSLAELILQRKCR